MRRLQSRGRVDKPIGTAAKGGTAATSSSTFQSKYRALLLGAFDDCFPSCRSASRRDDRQWAVDNGLEGARSMLAGGLFGLSRSSGNLSVACLPVRLPGIRKRGSSTVSQRIARRGEERGQAVGKRPRGDRVAARRRATTDELGSHVREEGVESEYIPGCQPRAEG